MPKGRAVIFLSAHRNGYLENGAGVPVAGADRPLMQVNDLLGQGKADAGFSAPSHVKAVKYMREICLINTISIVLDSAIGSCARFGYPPGRR